MLNRSGIYKIYCEISRKAYIGSSVNVRKRRDQHLHHLRKNKHPNGHLQSAYNKYGEDNFSWSLVLECDPEQLLVKEEEQIKEHNSFKEGYNLIETPTTNRLGCKHTEEAKRKMSIARRRREKFRTHDPVTEAQVREMREKYFYGARIGDLAKEYGLHRKTIRECVTLETYPDIPCEIKGYEKMLEELRVARERGERPRSRGWKHDKKFIEKFREAVSKPRAAHKRALAPEQVREIRHRSAQGETYRILAEEFGVNQNSISRIVRRLTYKDIE